MKLPNKLIVLLVALIFLALLVHPRAFAMQQFVDELPFKSYLPVIHRSLPPPPPAPPERLGPYGAKVTTVVIHPTNPSIVYAGTWGNGVYKSIDGGVTWSPSSAGLTNLMVQSLAIAPSRPNAVYVGLYYMETGGNGVFKTINSGASWLPTGVMRSVYDGQTIQRPIVYSLAVHPWDSDVVYAGTRMANLVPGQAIYGGGGVFKTDDGGGNWFTVNNGLPANDLYVYDLAIDPGQPDRIFSAFHESGVYQTTNGGGTWVNSNANIPLDPTDGVVSSGRAIIIDPSYTKRLYYGTYHRQGLFSTTNQAVSWFQDGLAGYKIVQLSLDPSEPKVVYATTNVDGVFITFNQGQTWSQIRPAGPGNSRVAVDPVNGNNLLVGTDNEGVFRSSDRGENWTASYQGISGYPVNTVIVDPSNPQVLYAAVMGRGVYKSNNRGASWVNMSSGIPDLNITDLAVDPAIPGKLYAATAGAGVFVSSNGAGSWAGLNNSYPRVSGERVIENSSLPMPVPEREPWEGEADFSIRDIQAAGDFAYALALGISPLQPANLLLGSSGKGIYRFSSGAWAATNSTTGSVYGFLFDSANPSVIYAGGSVDAGGVLKSVDGGTTWTITSSGLAGRTVYALTRSGNGTLYIGTDAGVYKSLDQGSSWVADGLSSEAVLSIYAPAAYPDVVYAGTGTQTYARYWNGLSWTVLRTELANTIILDITRDPALSNSYYISTRLGGVYRVIDVP